MLILAYKYITQSDYINKTETRHQQRPMVYDKNEVFGGVVWQFITD